MFYIRGLLADPSSRPLLRSFAGARSQAAIAPVAAHFLVLQFVANRNPSNQHNHGGFFCGRVHFADSLLALAT
jgi:hypothetical protein